ncbi:MAG: SLC13 family permease [Micavibrio sp.]|nr:SLC13 family permease [Micavibrio sp.]
MFEFYIPTNFQMHIIFAMTVLTIIAFIREKHPIEMICFFLLCGLLLFGQFFPVLNEDGDNLLSSAMLLSGFANPSLIAVLALLVMGQGILQTDALQPFTRLFKYGGKKVALFSIFMILIMVAALSGFMNNTPLVILAIPVIQSLVQKINVSQGRVMMPLSFVAILGGMTTLVGSSTNLLVSSTLQEIGYEGLTFFQFFVPGCILAGIGLVYVLFVMPFIMPKRDSITDSIVEDNDKEFVAEVDVNVGSALIGEECVKCVFPSLRDIRIKLIQRRGHIILPPFEGYKLDVGDVIIISATRKRLSDLLARFPGFLLSQEKQAIIAPDEDEDEGADSAAIEQSRVLAEVSIPPNSRFIDMSVEQVGFGIQFGAIVLGIQRRSRIIRRRFGRIRLEAGDVLLIAGPDTAVNNMRGNKDIIVLSGSKAEVPRAEKAPRALAIFVGTIVLAAMGILTIPVAAVTGAVAMIATGCMNIRQATRAIDRKIFLLVGSMLALGTALNATDGATFIANSILELPLASSPLTMISLFFILIAISTNILTNNACAILFTPIAVSLAASLNIDPMIFAICVVFAANCSFASPIGYQTNLLVMGPGHYNFRDFIVAGMPLILIIWAAFIAISYFYYGIPF